VETVRDLARDEPWRESLERSLERRARSRRSSIKRHQPWPSRAPAHERRSVQASATSRGLRRQAVAKRRQAVESRHAIAKHRRAVARGATGIVALLLLGAIPASAVDDHAPQVSRTAAHADVTPAGQRYANARQVVPGSGGAGLTKRRTCPLVVGSTGYVNPLARATVKPERIDQGVDYAGSGTLSAIGAARVTHLATYGTGWPGAFIEYQLLDGPDAGCYVFYAEGVTPKPGLRVGHTIRAGRAVATIVRGYPTGFEIGWGAGVDTRTYAALTHRWSAADDQHSIASGPGKNFSALIASLGGPPGKVEGKGHA
jgi:hypothetical protein